MSFGLLVDRPAQDPQGRLPTDASDAQGDGTARGLWPLPALATWGLAWALQRGALSAGWSTEAAVAVGCAASLALSWWADTRWRRGLMAAGFPLSYALIAAASGLPAWSWLLPLALLGLAYPLHAWRDAPLFPTPVGALDDLPRHVPLPPQARVLDAGCGLGHGLEALRRAYPLARLEGIEWSWPIAIAARWRCRDAQVHRGDMWRDGAWRGHDLVYLFQRPESMARALAKAEAELADGAWMASLEFAVPGREPDAVLSGDDGRPVWLYRISRATAAPTLSADDDASSRRRRR